MKRAIERHDSKEARVIPVILRDCDWHSAPFGKLVAAPRDGKPVTLWPDIDQAFADVAKQVRRAVEEQSDSALKAQLLVPRAADARRQRVVSSSRAAPVEQSPPEKGIYRTGSRRVLAKRLRLHRAIFRRFT